MPGKYIWLHFPYLFNFLLQIDVRIELTGQFFNINPKLVDVFYGLNQFRVGSFIHLQVEKRAEPSGYPCNEHHVRIPMMSISHSDLMPIRSERSDAELS